MSISLDGWYFMDYLSSGDLFCTYTSSLWPILHFLTVHTTGDLFSKHISSLSDKWFCTYGGLRWLFSVHIPPSVNVIPISPTSSWPCLYTRDFYGLFCIFTSPWGAYVYIFYVYMTYSVHMPSLAHLFCMYGIFSLPIFTHTSPSRLIFYKYKLFMTYFVDQ